MAHEVSTEGAVEGVRQLGGGGDARERCDQVLAGLEQLTGVEVAGAKSRAIEGAVPQGAAVCVLADCECVEVNLVLLVVRAVMPGPIVAGGAD